MNINFQKNLHSIRNKTLYKYKLIPSNFQKSWYEEY